MATQHTAGYASALMMGSDQLFLGNSAAATLEDAGSGCLDPWSSTPNASGSAAEDDEALSELDVELDNAIASVASALLGESASLLLGQASQSQGGWELLESFLQPFVAGAGTASAAAGAVAELLLPHGGAGMQSHLYCGQQAMMWHIHGGGGQAAAPPLYEAVQWVPTPMLMQQQQQQQQSAASKRQRGGDDLGSGGGDGSVRTAGRTSRSVRGTYRGRPSLAPVANDQRQANQQYFLCCRFRGVTRHKRSGR